MDKQKKINRKKFFQWASLALLLPFFKLWQNTVDRQKTFSASTQTITINENLPEGVHFFDAVILIKTQGVYRLFSAKCTHLGCRINKTENGELVCPCHGSRYNYEGVPLKGPSIKSLTEIVFQVENAEGMMILQFTL